MKITATEIISWAREFSRKMVNYKINYKVFIWDFLRFIGILFKNKFTKCRISLSQFLRFFFFYLNDSFDPWKFSKFMEWVYVCSCNYKWTAHESNAISQRFVVNRIFMHIAAASKGGLFARFNLIFSHRFIYNSISILINLHIYFIFFSFYFKKKADNWTH